MSKKKFYVRIVALFLAVVLTIPTNMDVQAAKGTIKSVSVTNLPAKTLTLKKGKTFKLKTKVKKTGSISGALVYKTSNSKVATVSNKGVIKAKKKGKANITVSAKANKKKKVTIKVTVGTPVTKVKLNKTKLSLNSGESRTLKVTLSPKKPSNKKIVWASSNTKVAKVNSKGKVTAVKDGTAVITATAADGSGKKAKCTVKVTTKVTAVALSEAKKSIMVGQNFTLKAAVTPKNATNTEVTWKSSNENVAVVVNGKVYGIKAGTATITATAKDGSKKSATCAVTVNNPTEITNAVVKNMQTIEMTLSNPTVLDASKITVKTRYYILSTSGVYDGNGVYNYPLKISGITTKDKLTYTITLDNESFLKEGQGIQITVKGLAETGTATVETFYTEGTFNYVINETITKEVNKPFKSSFDFDGIGYHQYTIDKLPAGITHGRPNDGMNGLYYGRSTYFLGTPTTIGVFKSVLVAKDDLGNTYTYHISWNIYGAEKITVSDVSYNTQIDSGSDETASVNVSLYPKGGSGSYTYEFVGAKHGLSINTNGKITGELTDAGVYSLSVRVSDTNNSALTAVAKVTIEVLQTINVVGMIKEAGGYVVDKAHIKFINKDKATKGTVNYTLYTNSAGTYSANITAGTYDVVISCNGARKFLYNQVFTTSKTGYDHTISDLYKITVYSNNEAVNATSFNTWYDVNGQLEDLEGRYYGSGNVLYLKAGKYQLKQSGSDFAGRWEATLNVTVTAGVNKATANVVIVAPTESIALNTTTSVTTNNAGVYFKFMPTASGTYYFYSISSIDTVGELYDSQGRILTRSDDGIDGSDFYIPYNFVAGNTYYLKACRHSSTTNATFNITISDTNP